MTITTGIGSNSTVLPAVNQIEYYPSAQPVRAAEANAVHDIATEAYSPLGLGDDLEHRVIGGIAARTGRTRAQVILRWHLQGGRIAIPKSVTPARITENIAVTDFTLTAEDIAAIDGLSTGHFVVNDPSCRKGPMRHRPWFQMAAVGTVFKRAERLGPK